MCLMASRQPAERARSLPRRQDVSRRTKPSPVCTEPQDFFTSGAHAFASASPSLNEIDDVRERNIPIVERPAPTAESPPFVPWPQAKVREATSVAKATFLKRMESIP